MRVIEKDKDSKIDVKFVCPESQEDLMKALAGMVDQITAGEFRYK